MNIVEAKQQVKYAVEAYLATDEDGQYRIPLSRQRPILLIGAPGIGKTAIMEQVAAELSIGIVSYSMTHHTRQSALGLPFIEHKEFAGHAYDVSEYTMSEIIASVYELMEKSGVTRGILFLDEVNCVSETLTPSMLQFLQYKTFGRHRVPEGWVIVTAGNPAEYNRSVHEFDIVTLDRVKRIEVEPDFDVWKTYAYETGVHESIMTFLEIKPERFYNIERTLSGKEFVTARGWVDLSEAIKLHEDLGFPIDEALVGQYVQVPDIAEEFALYYELFNRYKREYGIEAILAGTVTTDVLARARGAQLDERLSLIGLLLEAAGGRMRHAVTFEADLLFVRDVLRDAKREVEDGQDAYRALDEHCAALSDELERGMLASSMDETAQRVRRHAVRMLRSAMSASNLGLMQGQDAFTAAVAAYERDVEAMGAAAREAQDALTNVFTFIEDAYGDGQEMLMFVTELTARPQCSRFISEFGNDAYFKHNSELLVYTREQDLRARIDELGLDVVDTDELPYDA